MWEIWSCFAEHRLSAKSIWRRFGLLAGLSVCKGFIASYPCLTHVSLGGTLFEMTGAQPEIIQGGFIAYPMLDGVGVSCSHVVA